MNIKMLLYIIPKIMLYEHLLIKPCANEIAGKPVKTIV